MSTLAPRDLNSVADLTRSLKTWRPGDQPALPIFLPKLRDVLGADKAIAYGISPRDRGVALSLFETSGLEAPTLKSAFEDSVKQELFLTNRAEARPVEPKREPDFRLLRGMADESGVKILDHIVPGLRLDGYDQLCALVCDMPTLLAWIGAFRALGFTRRELEIVSRLTPALRERLALERQLAESALNTAALAAAMEAISSPAYIVALGGVVKHANSAGKALLNIEPQAIDWLSSVREPDCGKFAITWLLVPRCEHYLAVLRQASNDPLPRLALATAHWKLTAKQTEVLRWLIRGASNKAIATALDCVEGTVELHVAAVLHKAKVEKRSELIAKFWMEP